ncbi:hypothetical protein CROQUDRAFT_661664 [Cronartium quercuum f. sp. fusiforme G11]|uniref:Uncharacterized protein n=1 Tax=Cronartium quercuum f. sp. fusiforme G11 TaxID=708437 RepID=A0A9P6T8N0_9BASI|nr:hypothetical protein CROQUDRAFT_661664 [Cronartium quercuum f. sp. fusiforme G11]
MVRRILQFYQLEKNTKKSRYNRHCYLHCYLPTSHRPNIAYFNPSAYNGVQGIIPVPRSQVNQILAQHFPDARELFHVSPPLLADHVLQVLHRFRIPRDSITLNNLWVVHQGMVTTLQQVQYHLYIMPEPDEPDAEVGRY